MGNNQILRLLDFLKGLYSMQLAQAFAYHWRYVFLLSDWRFYLKNCNYLKLSGNVSYYIVFNILKQSLQFCKGRNSFLCRNFEYNLIYAFYKPCLIVRNRHLRCLLYYNIPKKVLLQKISLILIQSANVLEIFKNSFFI